jgi:hypothetical protein
MKQVWVNLAACSATRADTRGAALPTETMEEPDVFNDTVDTFLASVARGFWDARDPRSRSASATGMT